MTTKSDKSIADSLRDHERLSVVAIDNGGTVLYVPITRTLRTMTVGGKIEKAEGAAHGHRVGGEKVARVEWRTGQETITSYPTQGAADADAEALERFVMGEADEDETADTRESITRVVSVNLSGLATFDPDAPTSVAAFYGGSENRSWQGRNIVDGVQYVDLADKRVKVTGESETVTRRGGAALLSPANYTYGLDARLNLGKRATFAAYVRPLGVTR